MDGAPQIYQETGGTRQAVAGRFRLLDSGTVGFEVTGPYDAARPMVIDPEVAWSTYIGGSGGQDNVTAIALDHTGEVYVTGRTDAGGWVSGGFDTTYGGGYEAFVVKLSAAGVFRWSTFLGSTGNDSAYSIAVDSLNNAYVCGLTTTADWISGGYHTAYGGAGDAFVVKLSPDGKHVWSATLGGTGLDSAAAIAVDGSDNVYVTGNTASSGWVSGGFRTVKSSGTEAFVVKLSSAGQHLDSTYLGGAPETSGCGIALDGSSNVLVTGYTTSTGWASGGFDTTQNGYEDVFVAKLTSSTQHLWSTYLGGGSNDEGQRIAVDGSGNVCVSGTTWSPGWVSGGYDTTYGGNTDAFAAKLTPEGAFLWSTYLGGNAIDQGGGLALDSVGNIYVTGSTGGTDWITDGSDGTNNSEDAFIAKLSPAGQLGWSTLLYGNHSSYGSALACDGADNIYLVGATGTGNWAAGGYDVVLDGSRDGFVAKLYNSGAAIQRGALSVLITPPEAMTAGGRWRRTGTPTWRDGGTTETGIAIGNYTVDFMPIGSDFWLPPPSQGVRIADGQTTVITAHYVRQTGSVFVALAPPAVVAAGAKWRRLGTTDWRDSNTTETGVPTGLYTIECKAVAGWTTPSLCNVSVYTNQQATPIGGPPTYVRQTGTLSVTILPPGFANSAGGWRRVGTTTWFTYPDREFNIPTGDYTVEFLDVANATTPPHQDVTIKYNTQTNISATYVLHTGTLQVTITPPAAVAAGAQWRRVGDTVWLNSGATQSYISPGDYSVEFKTIPQMVTPAPLPVTIAWNKTTQAAGNYLPAGNLRVTIAPDGVLATGAARWRRTGTGTWWTSGATETNIMPGGYQVEFNAVSSWNTPANIPVTVNSGSTATATGTYIHQTGSLWVSISPPAAVAAGAKWRRVGTTLWHDSATTETGVTTGLWPVEFKTVSGDWAAPMNQTAYIYNNAASTLYANYPAAGYVKITITPPEAVAAGAQWRYGISPTWLDSGVTTTGVQAGTCFIFFKNIPNWAPPILNAVTVNTKQLTEATGNYLPRGSVFVTITPAEAVTAGAKWRRVGTTAWLSSGTTETLVPPGSQTVEFLPLTGWTTPASQALTVNFAQTAITGGAYVRQTGSLGVTLTPPEAVAAGAKWRRTGTTAWLNSGTTETAVPTGSVTIEFSHVPGWITPAAQTFTINNLQRFAAGAGYRAASAELSWSSYMGDGVDNSATAVAVDGTGNIYVTGYVFYSAGWFTGGGDTAGNGLSGASFVLKLTATGQPLWCAYLGGSSSALGIAVDGSDNVIVTGRTSSAGWARGGYDTTFNSRSPSLTDGFVVKLTPNGGQLWSTYLGGMEDDACCDVAVDSSNNIVVTGYTNSPGWVSGGVDTAYGNGTFNDTTDECFIAKLSSSGQHLWSTYHKAGQAGSGIAVDGAANIYVTGAAFLSKFSPTGQLLWSNSIGSSPVSETDEDIAVDRLGNIWVTGSTITPVWLTGGYDTTLNPLHGQDGFLLRLTSAGQVLWGTYLGGAGTDEAWAVAVDGAGNAYVTGCTFSGGWISGDINNTPTSSTFSGQEAYVVKLSTSGQQLWSTYLGGVGRDYGYGIAVSGAGNVTVVGRTEAVHWLGSPIGTSQGGNDGFVVQIQDTGKAGPAGSLGVMINPAEAVAAGAQWRRVGTVAWHDSGTMETGVPAGICWVEFKPTPGWVPPAYQSLTIANSQASTMARSYVRGASLHVTLTPAGAVAAGGQWRRVGTTAWLASGAVDADLTAGACQVELKPMATWATPAPQTVTLVSGQTADLALAYTRVAADLTWSSYLGAPDVDDGNAVAVDNDGNIYVAGTTNSAGWVQNGYDTTFNATGRTGYTDAFVAKLTPAGQLDWSTYLGGDFSETGTGIALDHAGNVCVCGDTRSDGWVSGGYDTVFGDYNDGFVVKLSPTGQFTWGTFIGGDGSDRCTAIAVDDSNNIFAVGMTSSIGWTSRGFDTTLTGTQRPFMIKLSPSGQQAWSTYFGISSIYDEANGLAVDHAGNAYATGTTGASPSWASGGYDTTPNGNYDAYVIKVSAGGQFVWSTYVGGSDVDKGRALALDSQGNIYLAGDTSSTDWISGGFDTTFSPSDGMYSNTDGFLAKLSPTGQPLWSTYLGGGDLEQTNAIAVDRDDNAYVAGATKSAGWISGGYDITPNGGQDAFVVKVSPQGKLRWSTYLGGANDESGNGIAVDGSGNVIVAGSTNSPGWISGGYDTTLGNDNNPIDDAFVAKLRQYIGLMVTLYPAEAAAAGAQWRLAGTTDWHASGYLLTGTTGTLTIEFKPVAGWTTPANQKVNVIADQLTEMSATYVRQTGSLQVTITPAEATGAGARWRRVGTTAWLGSGAIESGVPTGSQTVEFQTLAGWTAPANQPVTITAGQTTQAGGAYLPQPGSLKVTITPAAAVTSGARWRRVGQSAWLGSGATEANLPAGPVTVEFKAATGWTTPPEQASVINRGQTTALSVAYAGAIDLVLKSAAIVAILPGKSATFKVAATGLPTITYQWCKNGAPIAGATAASYTITACQSTDVASYTCLARNDYAAARSEGFQLIVNNGGPVIAYLLGLSNNASGLDLNGDKKVDIGDVLKGAWSTPPDAPGAPYPANGAVGTGVRLRLNWADCGRALNYDVYLWISGANRPAAPAAAGLAQSQYDVTGLDPATTYKWQVIAHGAQAQISGPVWTFTTSAE